MQDGAVKVESNIVASNQLRGKSDKDRIKSRTEASTSDSSIVHPQVDELTKLVKSIFAEMEKLKFEGKQTYRNTKMLIKEVVSEDLIMFPRLLEEIPETEKGMTKRSKLPYKTTF
jgi:GTPase Era involved in 16S rRNA processing